MKLWVVGASGLLGSALLELCRTRGVDAASSVRGDVDLFCLEEIEQFVQSHQITHIVNCVAYTNVDLAEEEVELAYQVNAKIPENLGKIAALLSLKLIHISTDFVFSGEKNEPYREEDLCAPLGNYGKSKLEGERLLVSTFPSACIVRTSNLFGRGGKSLSSKLFQLLQTNAPLTLVFDLVSRATYSKDLAELLIALLPHSGIFHFANVGSCNRLQMAEEARLLLPKSSSQFLPILSRDCFAKHIRPRYSVLSTKKIEALLNIKPRSWQEALKEFSQHAL